MVTYPLLRPIDLLDKADAIRRKRQQAIKLADDFLRSVFLEMFGDPVINPKGWEVKTLGEVLKEGITNGIYAEPSLLGSGIPLLDNKGLFRGLLADFSKTRFLRLSESEIEKYSLINNDIVMNRVSVAPEGVGVSVLVEGLHNSCVFESNIMRIRVDSEKIRPFFLVYLMCLPCMRIEIRKRATIANQASINQGAVKSIPVLIPSLKMQDKFIKIYKELSKINSKQKTMSNEADVFFKSISQNAFSGEL